MPMRTDVTISVISTLPVVTAARIAGQRRQIVTSAPRKTSDQTTRCATISVGATCTSALK
jgi:hypothetical protein